MKRIKLIVAYDGTNYCGWQYQTNGITIEEVLNKHLSVLLKEEIHIMGASRTDAGVHALGNVAVFDTKTRIPGDRVSFALNARLPEDIRIQDSCEVDCEFHPRYCNTVKTYEYRILNRRFPDPTCRLNTFFFYMPLDVELMKQGAGYLTGEHDFKSFCTPKTKVVSTVRKIYSLEISKNGDLISLKVTGNGFLYHMIRIIAGTLMDIGLGLYPPEQIQDILEKKDRREAGPTARPEGLTLLQILYAE